ncbi:MAG TPA: hypothetical protein VK363_14700 [Pyrinomonadaceae bacterium]|nr:hypothetical protein [Pyrinomonadaceae bacterium]
MSGTKGGTKKQADKARASMLSLLNDFDPNHLVLPLDEIRLLALLFSTRNGVEPFVRRMVLLSEALKAGRTSRAAQLARRSRDQSLTELLLPMAQAIEDGRVVAVRNTAFCAASFAYQNSLDYLRDLLNYMDRFRSHPRPTHSS